AVACAQVHEARRLAACKEMLDDVAKMPEGLSRDWLNKAECVVLVPGVKKAALGVGGRYGKGAVVCRKEGGHGPWGPPSMIELGGGGSRPPNGGPAIPFLFLVT